VPEGEKVRVKVNSIDVDPDENVTPVEEPEEVTVDVEEPEEEEPENESIPDAVEEL
jgi:hypothetical protein